MEHNKRAGRSFGEILYDTEFWISALVNGRQLPLAGVSVPSTEASKAERFPGQHRYVLSILPRLSSSGPNYLREEEHESGCPLDQKRSKTKQTEKPKKAGSVTWREWTKTWSLAEMLAGCVESPFLLLTHFSRVFVI